VREQLDRACLKSIDTFKRNDQSSQAWWAANKSWVSLLLPWADTDKCMAEKSKWKDVEEELVRVCSSCESGPRLFGRASQQLYYDTAVDKIVALIAKLENQGLTLDNLQNNRKTFNDEMQNINCHPIKAFPKRATMVCYRGAQCTLTVFSFQRSTMSGWRLLCEQKQSTRECWQHFGVII